MEVTEEENEDTPGLDVDKSPEITLLAEGEKIKADKSKLAKASEYFNAMFRSNMKESFSREISIHDVQAWVLQALVQFSDRHTIELTMNTVYDILSAACMLQFSGVVDACTEYLSKDLSVLNCLNIMFTANRNGLQALYFKAKRIALWFFPDVCEEEEFWQLPLAALQEYLSNDMLKIEGEKDLVYAIFKWTMYNSTDRILELPQALESVRLGLLSEDDLKLIRHHEFIQASPKAMELVTRVLSCKTGENVPIEALPENCFKERISENEIWLIGGELLYPDRKAPHCNILLFDEKEKQVHDIYEKLPPLVGHEREYLGYRSCLVGKDLYLCGGEITMGRNRWQLNVWKFDTFEESWEAVSQLPQPRRQLALVAIDTDLYLIGGFGRHRIVLESVEKYDTVTGDWSTVPSLHRAVYSAAACRHGNRLYVIKHDVESYSPGDAAWTTITMPLPFEIGIQTCVSLASKIYIMGSYILDLIELDVDTLKLTKLGTFKDACGPAVAVDGVIYVLSGDNAELIESYNIHSGEFQVEVKMKMPLVFHSAAVVPCFPGYGKSAEAMRALQNRTCTR